VIEMYVMFGTRYSDGLKYRNVAFGVCFKLVSLTGAVQVHCAGFISVCRVYCHVSS